MIHLIVFVENTTILGLSCKQGDITSSRYGLELSALYTATTIVISLRYMLFYLEYYLKKDDSYQTKVFDNKFSVI